MRFEQEEKTGDLELVDEEMKYGTERKGMWFGTRSERNEICNTDFGIREKEWDLEYGGTELDFGKM